MTASSPRRVKEVRLQNLATPTPHRRFRHNIVLGCVMCALVLLQLGSPLAPGASAQVQGVGLGITPLFPPAVTVGQVGVGAQMGIINNSGGVGPVTLNAITLNPACGDTVPTCADPDLGVLALAATGIGTVGACTGVGFTITGPDGNGTSLFTPAAPVVLQPPGQPNDDCTIAFTFSVLKAPTKDADASAGIQTREYAATSGTAFTPLLQLLSGTATGTSITTITKVQPAITTRASGSIDVGATISDVANLSGGVNPTGVITFRLYGPDDPTCTGIVRFSSTRVVMGNGDHVSDTYTPQVAGAFAWAASYDGDVNNFPVSESACNDPLEAVTVSRQIPPTTTTVVGTPTTTAPPVPVPPTVPPGSPTTPTTVPPPQLGHTGSNVAAQAAVALLLLVVGAQLVVGTLRRREGYDWRSW
jgi:hypothetical protein